MYTYVVNHIPISQDRRPGIETKMESITVHNTANPTSTANNERNWLVNPQNNRTASWHIAVDDKQVVEAIPLHEVAWHAGTRQGNFTSIGIEVCESGDQEQVWENTVILIASLLFERGWDTGHVKTHKYWSGKNCPRLLLTKWDAFIQDIGKNLEKLTANIAKEEKIEKNVQANPPKWKMEGIEYLAEKGLIKDKDQWLTKIDESMPVWAAMLLLKRIHEDRNM